MKVRRLLFYVFVALIVGGIGYAMLPGPVEVDVARAKRGRIEMTVDEDGRTRIRDRYVVAAPLAGQTQRIDLKPGDPVFAGKTILTLIEPSDPLLLDARSKAEAEGRVRSADAKRKHAEAKIGYAKEAHLLAKNELDRAAQLVRTNSIAREAHEAAIHKERMARQEVRMAESGYQIAEHERAVAEAALIRTEPRKSGEPPREPFAVYSPISGRVLRVHQESATVVAPGHKLLEVGDPTDLEIEIDVLSRDGARVGSGAKVYLEHWGGDTLTARVRLVEPSAFLKISALGVEEQRVNVIADLVEPPEKRKTLLDAFRVEARIVVGDKDDVLKVPAGALFRQGDGWAVFLVRDGKSVLRPVKVGFNNGLEAEIVEGLDESDQVVLHPSDKVRDGAAVKKR